MGLRNEVTKDFMKRLSAKKEKGPEIKFQGLR